MNRDSSSQLIRFLPLLAHLAHLGRFARGRFVLAPRLPQRLDPRVHRTHASLGRLQLSADRRVHGGRQLLRNAQVMVQTCVKDMGFFD